MANDRSSDTTNYFSGYFNQSPGIASVGSYQVAGMPWVTGSEQLEPGQANEQRIRFPAVTKAITVRNTSTQAATAELRVFFSSDKDSGDRDVENGRHFITLYSPAHSAVSDGWEFKMDVKCQEIFVQAVTANASFEVVAELTGIDVANMIPLSGSGINTLNPDDGTTP